MKNQIILTTLVVIGLLAGSPTSAFAEKVKFSELPAAVQTAVKSQAGSAEIEDIDKEIRNGKVVYEVAFKKNGKHTELIVAADGAILDNGTGIPTTVAAASNPKATLSGATKVSMNDVPPIVQNAIRSQAGRSRIEDIDKGTLNGKTVYQAAYKKDGEHVELRVAEDGTVMTETKTESLVAALNSFPAEVQKTVRTQVGAGQIIDLDRDARRSGTVYAVEFQRDGKNQVIQVAEDGTLIRHKVRSGKALDQGGVKSVEQGRASAGDQIISSPRQELRKVSMNELPLAVQNTIRSQAGRESVPAIGRQIKDGRLVYHATFTRNGRDTDLSIAEDGTILDQKTSGGRNSSLFGLTVDELPKPVQNTVKAAQIGGAEVANIDTRVRNGKTLYVIELEQQGKTREILISEDGSIVSQRP